MHKMSPTDSHSRRNITWKKLYLQDRQFTFKYYPKKDDKPTETNKPGNHGGIGIKKKRKSKIAGTV